MNLAFGPDLEHLSIDPREIGFVYDAAKARALRSVLEIVAGQDVVVVVEGRRIQPMGSDHRLDCFHAIGEGAIRTFVYRLREDGPSELDVTRITSLGEAPRFFTEGADLLIGTGEGTLKIHSPLFHMDGLLCLPDTAALVAVAQRRSIADVVRFDSRLGKAVKLEPWVVIPAYVAWLMVCMTLGMIAVSTIDVGFFAIFALLAMVISALALAVGLTNLTTLLADRLLTPSRPKPIGVDAGYSIDASERTLRNGEGRERYDRIEVGHAAFGVPMVRKRVLRLPHMLTAVLTDGTASFLRADEVVGRMVRSASR